MAEGEAVRLSSVDILKGLTIVCIVLVHVVIRRGEGGGEMPLFMQALYLILMVFFLISGYFYRPGKGFVYNMKKRVLQLGIAIVICSFVLTAIISVWLFIFGQSPEDPVYDYFEAVLRALNLTNLFEPVGEVLLSPISGASIGYYYIWVMLIAFIIFYGLADHVMDDWYKIAATIIALLVITCLMVEFVGVVLPFFAHLSPIAAAFMFMGAALSKLKVVERIESFEFKSARYWSLLIVSAVCLVVLLVLFHPGSGFDQLYFGSMGGLSAFVYFIQATLMFIICLYVAALLSKVPGLTWFFSLFGRHTLGILLLHGFFIKMMMVPFFQMTDEMWFPGGMSAVQMVLLAIGVFGACLLVCEYGPKIIGKLSRRDAVKGRSPCPCQEDVKDCFLSSILDYIFKTVVILTASVKYEDRKMLGITKKIGCNLCLKSNSFI